MYQASDVAKYLLCLEDEDAGDTISNLKLQKLLYYAQGFHLAMNEGAPLFPEEIRAWMHGPVVREVWEEYRDHGSNAIAPPEDFDMGIIQEDAAMFLKEIHNYFGQFSAWKLRNMTHEETPWAETTRDDVIDHTSLKCFFDTQLA